MFNPNCISLKYPLEYIGNLQQIPAALRQYLYGIPGGLGKRLTTMAE